MNSGDVVFNGQRYEKKLKFYSLDLVRTDVASAVFTGQIRIDAGCPFLLDVVHASDTADGLDLNSQEGWDISVVDNEGGYQWMEGSYASRSAFAGGRFHGRTLRGENLIRANTVITVTIRNAAADITAGTAKLTLQGWNLR